MDRNMLRSVLVTWKKRENPPDPEVGKRFARAIALSGVSQAEIARRIGKSPSAITQIVRGQTLPRDETAKSIARETGDDWKFLMGRKDTATVGLGALYGKLHDVLGDDLLRFASSMDAGELRALLEFARQRQGVPALAAATKSRGRKKP
jgi:transcriptional regulator with XRE-family HTH domain